MSKTLGNRIKLFRNKEGLSREELSLRLQISIYTLIKYEQGQREPNIETLRKISDELNVNVSTLTSDDIFETELLTRAISICIFDLQYGSKDNVLKKLGEYTGYYETLVQLYEQKIFELPIECSKKLIEFIYTHSKKEFENIYNDLIFTNIYNLSSEIEEYCDKLKCEIVNKREKNKEESLGHLYEYINSYAVKNGKDFMLSDEYWYDIFEFVENVQSLLENKIYKIELEIEKNKNK